MGDIMFVSITVHIAMADKANTHNFIINVT